jgi:SAM-dependent methyltransferase
MDSLLPSIEPFDLSGFTEDTRLHAEIKAHVRVVLSELRARYPQIPKEPKRLEAVGEKLANLLSKSAGQPDFSMLTLAQWLGDLQVKGFGQANDLWPWLFALSSGPELAPEAVDIGGASRIDLSRKLRSFLGGYFKSRPEKLEWIIAAVIAWRPGSLRALHHLIARVDSSFLAFDVFERSWMPYFSFSAMAAENKVQDSPPDWTRVWEAKKTQTLYGGDYPPSISAFLVEVLSEIRDRDPYSNILDIGTGNHAATLLARSVSSGFELYGIDYARLQVPADQARIHVLQMNAEHLAFRDHAFAAVVSVNGIEYADTERALPEMYRVMRPGAVGALVLHRPDSFVVARARRFNDLLESAPVMETLAMAWLYFKEGTDLMRRELEREILRLEKRNIDEVLGTSFFEKLWDELRTAMRSYRKSDEAALGLVELREEVLHWTHQKNRFLASRMDSLASNREQVTDWLTAFGYVIDGIEDLRLDAAFDRSPIGWAVRLHKPATG